MITYKNRHFMVNKKVAVVVYYKSILYQVSSVTSIKTWYSGVYSMFCFPLFQIT